MDDLRRVSGDHEAEPNDVRDPRNVVEKLLLPCDVEGNLGFVDENECVPVDVEQEVVREDELVLLPRRKQIGVELNSRMSGSSWNFDGDPRG